MIHTPQNSHEAPRKTPQSSDNQIDIRAQALARFDSSLEGMPVLQTWSDMFEVGHRIKNAYGQEDLEGYGGITYWQGVHSKTYQGHFAEWTLVHGSLEYGNGEYKEGFFIDGNTLHGKGKRIHAKPIDKTYENWKQTTEETWYFQHDSLIYGTRRNLQTGHIEHVFLQEEESTKETCAHILKDIKDDIARLKTEEYFDHFMNLTTIISKLQWSEPVKISDIITECLKIQQKLLQTKQNANQTAEGMVAERITPQISDVIMKLQSIKTTTKQ